jgi:large subunit ribosomal protein L15
MAKKIVRKKSNRTVSKAAKETRNRYNLETLRPASGSRKRKVRVGRGMGSKLGRTSGKGNKGQKSRRGYSRRRGFEGGQMPLHRRIPKRGFHSPFGKTYAVINLQDLNVFPAGETVTPDLLRSHGFVRTQQSVKILGDGELQNKLVVHAHAFSGSAKDKITKAGGSFEILAS